MGNCCAADCKGRDRHGRTRAQARRSLRLPVLRRKIIRKKITQITALTSELVGLGNPGAKYANTRHNVGKMALDFYANSKNLIFEKKDFGEVTYTSKAMIIKSTTFMNVSERGLEALTKHFFFRVKNQFRPFSTILGFI